MMFCSFIHLLINTFFVTILYRLLYESGYADIIDVVYTSRLKRAIKSAWIIVQEISAPFLPIYKSWRLNERHYGSLTGLCKKEAAKTLGVDVVQAW